VWALLSLFDKPFTHTVFAAKLAATRANDGVFYLSKANETLEQLVKICVGALLLLFTMMMSA